MRFTTFAAITAAVAIASVVYVDSLLYPDCQVRLDDTLRCKAVFPITKLSVTEDDFSIEIDDVDSVEALNAALRDAIYFGDFAPEGAMAFKGSAEIGSSSPARFTLYGSKRWQGFYIRYAPPDYMMDSHAVFLSVLLKPIPAPLQLLIDRLSASAR